MRWLILVFSVMIVSAGCGLQKKAVDNADGGVKIANEAEADSVEYDIAIIDPGFDSWFVKNRKPKWYYEQSYLENWNIRYVTEWNQRVMNGTFQSLNPDNPFDELINYEAHEDYGLAVNWKLFHYFKYIESSWGKIL